MIDLSLIREGLATSDFFDAPRIVLNIEHCLVHHLLLQKKHSLPEPNQQYYIDAVFSCFDTADVMEWAIWCDENANHIPMSGVA